MTETLPRLDEPGDAELISAVRGGDVSAYGGLFERHVAAARRLARQLVGPADADDLVSDAYMKVLRVLQNGGGPDVAFRAYLLTAVRRLHVDKIRAGAKLHSTDDMEAFDPGVPFRDTAVEGFENAAAAKAFTSLPERWQLVLWHTEVEGQKPAEVAALLGISPNSVSALAYRAREGLRQAFLNSHAEDMEDTECRWTHEHLGPYIRNGVSKRDATKVEKHLDDCRKCMAIYLELTEVNSNLGGILAPLLLGGAGAGYLASAGSIATKGGLLLLLDRAKETIASNGQAAAVAGVAAATVVVAAAIAVVSGGDDPSPVAKPPASAAPAPSDTPSPPPATSKKPTPAPVRTAPPPAPVDEPPEQVATTEAAAPSQAAAPPVEVVEEPPPAASEPAASKPAVKQPPRTSAPPPPSSSPPPTFDLTVDLTVEPQGGNANANSYRASVTSSGYAPDGNATLTLRWQGLEIQRNKLPAGCTTTGSQLRCRLSAADSVVRDIRFHSRGGVNVLPSVTATISATNFEDDNGGNNSDEWQGTLAAAGVHVGHGALDTLRP